MYHRGVIHLILFFIRLKCCPSACAFLASESDAILGIRTGVCHISDVVCHGSGVGVLTSDWALLCPVLSKGTASSGRTTASSFQGASFSLASVGVTCPCSGCPLRLSPLRGLHGCVLAVSVQLRSQPQGEEVMLPWRCMWATSLWSKSWQAD